jgi:hypothetical protein
MYYDLNVPYSPGDPEISATLSFLAERMPPFYPFSSLTTPRATRPAGVFPVEYGHMKS